MRVLARTNESRARSTAALNPPSIENAIYIILRIRQIGVGENVLRRVRARHPLTALLCSPWAASIAYSSRRCCYSGAWQASARQLANPCPWWQRQRFWLTKVSVILTTCRSLANMLPAAVGATLVGAVAYCELLPQCFCCLSAADAASACVQLPWRPRSPRRISLVPTRALHRRRRRCSCADTPLVTTLFFPTVRRLPQRTSRRGEVCSQATCRIRR